MPLLLQEMPTVNHNDLQTLVARIFTRHEIPDTIAKQVASSLVSSNLAGHDSHGVAMTPLYIQKIRDGKLYPQATPMIRKLVGATICIDCRYGFGHLGAKLGVETAIQYAREWGISTVALENANHVGRLGAYGEEIAEAGLVGMAIASGAGPGGSVAPYGGARRVFGTNPVMWSIPRPHASFPLVLDMATSNIAWGKISLAKEQETRVKPGSLIDSQGKPTDDPNAFFEGGAILPFGGHKGSGLALVAEIMANLFCGFAPATSSEFRFGNPMVITVWNIEAFCDRERFDRLVDELCGNIKSTPPAEGFDEVLLPGESEFMSAEQRSNSGIHLPDSLWQKLNTLNE